MVGRDPALIDEYRAAWEAWQKQLTTLHAVFLDNQELDPPRLKGLLNREARAKDRYDAARLALLGIPTPAPDAEAAPPKPPGPPR